MECRGGRAGQLQRRAHREHPELRGGGRAARLLHQLVRGIPAGDFSFHHALLPLVDDSAVRKELALYRQIYPEAWGATPAVSQGFFPSEMAFSTRLIPLLQEAGIQWSFVSSEKLSRACTDFPVVFGSGGVQCDPPNRADQLNAAGVHWDRVTISRGCGPAEAVPFGHTPHRAQYVNPATGAVSEIVVVPCSQSLGWMDGYSPMGIDNLARLHGGGTELRVERVRRRVRAHGGAALPGKPPGARRGRGARGGRRVGQRGRRLRRAAVPQLELAAGQCAGADRHRRWLGRGHPQLGRHHRRAELRGPCRAGRCRPIARGAHGARAAPAVGHARERTRVALLPGRAQLGLHVLRHRRRHGGEAHRRVQRGDRAVGACLRRRRGPDGADRLDPAAVPVEPRRGQFRSAVRLPAEELRPRLHGLDVRARHGGPAVGAAQVARGRRRAEPAVHHRERDLRRRRRRGRVAERGDDAPRLPGRELLQQRQHRLLRDAQRDREAGVRVHRRPGRQAHRLLRGSHRHGRQREEEPDPARLGGNGNGIRPGRRHQPLRDGRNARCGRGGRRHQRRPHALGRAQRQRPLRRHAGCRRGRRRIHGARGCPGGRGARRMVGEVRHGGAVEGVRGRRERQRMERVVRRRRQRHHRLRRQECHRCQRRRARGD
ncbi:MAG: hypothetical protein EBU31_05945, partial [Proteobacteria bacterium]|nr:hypothetical protein [Pseudomonadota bacterium]